MLFAAAVLALLAGSANAEVADAAAGGFTIKHTLTINAAPGDVYKQFIRIGDWWSPVHTYSGDAHNLSMEEKPGGCFCEKFPGGGVRHMAVVTVMPVRRLVMIGGLGPLQSMAATGSMTIDFAAAGDGTKLTVTYAVMGYSAAGMNVLAAPVDGVLGEQLQRLKALIEHGSLPAK